MDSFFLRRASGGATMDQIDRLLDVIRGRNAKTVGLQFPVGLRTTAVDLARELETKAGVVCLVSADPSFGACDVAEMPVDLIVHLGHAPMPHLRYNRVFFYDLPGAPLASMAFVDAAEPMLPKRVALLTTTQFRHWLPDIQRHLEKKGHVVRSANRTGGWPTRVNSSVATIIRRRSWRRRSTATSTSARETSTRLASQSSSTSR